MFQKKKINNILKFVKNLKILGLDMNQKIIQKNKNILIKLNILIKNCKTKPQLLRNNKSKLIIKIKLKMNNMNKFNKFNQS